MCQPVIAVTKNHPSPCRGALSGTASHPDKWALTRKGGSCSDLDVPALQSPAHCEHLSIPFGNRPKGMLSLCSVPMAAVSQPTCTGLMAPVLVAKAITLKEGLGLLCASNKLIFIKGIREDIFFGCQGRKNPGDVQEGKSHTCPFFKYIQMAGQLRIHFLHGFLPRSEPDRLGLLAMGSICTHTRTLLGMMSQVAHAPVVPASPLINRVCGGLDVCLVPSNAR